MTREVLTLLLLQPGHSKDWPGHQSGPSSGPGRATQAHTGQRAAAPPTRASRHGIRGSATSLTLWATLSPQETGAALYRLLCITQPAGVTTHVTIPAGGQHQPMGPGGSGPCSTLSRGSTNRGCGAHFPRHPCCAMCPSSPSINTSGSRAPLLRTLALHMGPTQLPLALPPGLCPHTPLTLMPTPLLPFLLRHPVRF